MNNKPKYELWVQDPNMSKPDREGTTSDSLSVLVALAHGKRPQHPPNAKFYAMLVAPVCEILPGTKV